MPTYFQKPENALKRANGENNVSARLKTLKRKCTFPPLDLRDIIGLVAEINYRIFCGINVCLSNTQSSLK